MKSHKFREDARRVQRSLEEIHRGLISEVLSELSRGKVTLSQYNLLSVLMDEKVCTMTRLAERLYVTTSAVTDMVSKLVKKKMVRRRRSRRDRRCVQVTITERGRRIACTVRRRVVDFYVPILARLGRKDCQELVRLQERICALIEERRV